MKDVPDKKIINLVIEEGQIFSDENQIDSNGDLIKKELKFVDSNGHRTPANKSRDNSVS